MSFRQNALEGAGAVLCAVVAMVFVSAVALSLLGADSYGSLSSLAMALTAMAVGGSASAGSASSGDTGSMGGLGDMFGGGGGMSASMSGAVDAMPLGVTLVGTVVLWIAFSRRMRGYRFTAKELAVRAAGAGAAALVIFMIVAGFARGTLNLPSSMMSGMGGAGGAQQDGGSGNPFGGGGMPDMGSGGMGGMPGMGGGGMPGMPGMGGDSGGNPFGDSGGNPFGGGGMPDFGSGGGGGMPGMGGGGGMPGMGGGGGMGGGMGGDSMASLSSMTYHTGVASAGFGAVLWVAVVLAVGCLISRRLHLPLSGALARALPSWAPSVSSLVRTLLVVAFVPLVLLAIIGGIVGGQAGGAAGAAILAAPNALAVFLSLGLGSSWKAGISPAQSSGENPMGGSGGMGGMPDMGSGGMGGGMPGMGGGMGGGMPGMGSGGGMPGMGGGTGGGMGGGSGMPGMGSGGMGGSMTNSTQYLSSLSVGGLPLWLGALAVTGIILLACAYRAARTTHPAHKLPLHPYRGPLAQHLGMAERFGVVTAVVLGGVVWLAMASGSFGVSMMGSQMQGMQAELSGSVLGTVVFGLIVGGLAGFGGSLLATRRTERAAR